MYTHLYYCTKPMNPSHFMDSDNNATTSSSSWDLDMGNPFFLDQFPYDLDYPIDPHQHHQIQFSSHLTTSNFPSNHLESHKVEQEQEEGESLGAMKEMMYKIAAMQPVDIDPSTIRKPKRRNVRISDDPQSIAARHRREKISERIRILQRLVPGGTKMDTASMLDEAIRYVKFLKKQVQELQTNQQSPIVEFDGHMAARNWMPAGRPNTIGSTSSMGHLPR